MLISGELGAGKSVLARGTARGLGATGWRGSPTFALINQYSTNPVLYHSDLYRLQAVEVEMLGLDECLRTDSVLLVEWPERAEEYLRSLAAEDIVRVTIDVDERERRHITVKIESTSAAGPSRPAAPP